MCCLLLALMYASPLMYLVLAEPGPPGVLESEDQVVPADDVPLQRFLQSLLSTHGFHVRKAGTIGEVERTLAKHRVAAILIDLGWPDRDGLDMLSRVRACSDAPAIIFRRELDGEASSTPWMREAT